MATGDGVPIFGFGAPRTLDTIRQRDQDPARPPGGPYATTSAQAARRGRKSRNFHEAASRRPSPGRVQFEAGA
ncbi:hypothetical protein GCM10027161_33150 [Microbispora hainanensis]